MSAHTDREDVADFAAYSIGSCYGDFHPAVAAEYAAVLRDVAVYEVWRIRAAAYDAASDAGACVFACESTPVSQGALAVLAEWDADV